MQLMPFAFEYWIMNEFIFGCFPSTMLFLNSLSQNNVIIRISIISTVQHTLLKFLTVILVLLRPLQHLFIVIRHDLCNNKLCKHDY